MTSSIATNITDRILSILNETPGLSDRELTDRIQASDTHPSQVNQSCRLLKSKGKLIRRLRSDGRIGNYPAGVSSVPVADEVGQRIEASASEALSEDQVRAHLKRWLEADGWQTEIAWGKARGTDIVAHRA